MHSKDYALVITGCIAPNNTVFSLELTDSQERLNQYLFSLKYYITDTLAKYIIFCDNSDFEYDYGEIYSLAEENGKNLEILRYKGNSKKILEHGKGYGEGEILEYALMHSKLVKQVFYVYKVTGRLIIKNFDYIVSCEEKENIYFNKNLYSYKTLDTRFWGMPRDLFVDLFMEQYHKVNDSELRFIEHVYYETISRTILEYKQHPFFPQIEGKSGSTNSIYKETKPIYFRLLTYIAQKGVFNNSLIYLFMYIVLHWEKCWKEFLGWIKSVMYHYYAESMVRIKKAYVLLRTFIYHYYAESMVRIKKAYVLSRTFIYHIYAEIRDKIIPK